MQKGRHWPDVKPLQHQRLAAALFRSFHESMAGPLVRCVTGWPTLDGGGDHLAELLEETFQIRHRHHPSNTLLGLA